METSYKQTKELVLLALKAGLVPNILGSPGVGKSELIKSIAKEHNLYLIDFRLAQADPTDLGGFPTLNKDRTRSTYAPPITLPLETDPIPIGYSGWLLFFDEINSAPQLTQAAAYKVILDRAVGSQKLHSKVAIACAGNLTTDRAIVNRLSTAMQSRLVHLNMKVDVKNWIKWALQKGINDKVIAFIEFRPDLLHRFEPKHTENTFPCPRTWFFVSKWMNKIEQLTFNEFPLLIGTVGRGAAAEFNAFCRFYSEIPTLEETLNNPIEVVIPTEPSLLFAYSSLLRHTINNKNAPKLILVIKRLPLEFQTILIQGAITKTPALLEDPVIKDWITENAEKLVG